MNQRKQEQPFDPARAARLDDPARFAYLPPEDLLRLLAPPHGSTLLDFGAGTATYALAFAEGRPDLAVIAYDPQPAMLELAAAKPAFAARGIVAAGRADLPRLKGAVDRLVSINVLHEIDDIDIIAMRALLKADGHGLIVDWDAEIERAVGPPTAHVHSLAEAVVRIGGYFTIDQTVRFANHFAILVKNFEIEAPR